jgi:hypothetical protein
LVSKEVLDRSFAETLVKVILPVMYGTISSIIVQLCNLSFLVDFFYSCTPVFCPSVVNADLNQANLIQTEVFG